MQLVLNNKKLNKIIKNKQTAAKKISKGLKSLEGLLLPEIEDDCTHVFYVYAMKIDKKIIKTDKELIVDAIKAEGLDGISSSYQNLHLLPLFQKKIAYGSKGFPWTSDIVKRKTSYSKGICPVAEELNDKTYIGYGICLHELNDNNIEMIINAFKKVWNNLNNLK